MNEGFRYVKCLRCCGTGLVVEEWAKLFGHLFEVAEVCPDCEGNGQLVELTTPQTESK